MLKQIPCTQYEEQLLRELESTEAKLERVSDALSRALALFQDSAELCAGVIKRAQADTGTGVGTRNRLIHSNSELSALQNRARDIVSAIAWGLPL